MFLKWSEVPFTQDVTSGMYASPFLDIHKLKMALRARKESGAIEKRTPGLLQRAFPGTDAL